MDKVGSIFVTGTDTDAGKTVVSSAIIKAVALSGMKSVGLKPIASGFDLVDEKWRNTDVDSLTAASNVRLPEGRVNRYSFKPAIAPHIAASQVNRILSFDDIKRDLDFAQTKADFVLVEGVGGWHVPLSDMQNGAVRDIQSLALHLAMPVVLVVGMRLGCINHAVLTANAIINSGLPFLGWVANHVTPDFDCAEENLNTLEALLTVPKLFEIPFLDDQMPFDASRIVQTGFIQSLCR